MPVSVLDEILRAKEAPTRPDVFKRWQQEIARDVKPLVERAQQAQAATAAQETR